jgi:DNA-binding IscR family transcriptional regulator
VLIGIRGPSGGYRLARERRRVTVGEIVRTIRGLETVEDPIEAGAGSALGQEVLRPLWLELQDETMKRLDALTLEDLCARAHRAGIAGRMIEGGDFSI